ncbi:MAG: hypothetical protein ACK4E8_08830 [Lacibacter sp.]|jgi:hypothetical protein
MRYSNYIGILAGILLLLVALQPWIYIASIQTTVTGYGASVKTVFGKPALMHVYLMPISAFFFLMPKIWAKRLNPLLSAIHVAWALRNVLLLSTCRNGECPERFIWLYVYFSLALLLFIMSLLPDFQLKRNDVTL